MGSVPNCQKEIPACHAIRWFKCKLKPPKKEDGSSRAANHWPEPVVIFSDEELEKSMLEVEKQVSLEMSESD